jgi:glycosidase
MNSIRYRTMAWLAVVAVLLSTAPAASARFDPAETFINVAGSFGSELGGSDWDPTDPTTQMDDANADGVWKFTTSSIPVGTWEYKVVEGQDWANAHPADNVSLEIATAGQEARFYYRPADHVVHDSTNQCIATVAGSFQSELGGGDWSPDSLVSWMVDPEGDGWYAFTAEIPAGDWEYKVARDEAWAESYPAANVSLSLSAPTPVTFRYNCATNAVRDSVNDPPAPGHDDDIWWDGLAHDSRDDLYRVPGGAVTTGVPITLRLRTYHGDVTQATLRVWSTAAGAQTLYPMALAATTDDPPYGYDYWQATIPAQDDLTILWYRFIVRDGSDEDFYEDDDAFDGGWGTPYDDSPDHSFQIDVYDPEFQTPEWMKNAVIYQIFPDRFYNGRRRNDPRAWDSTVYENPVLVKSWDDLPEGYCRGYVDTACDEEPMGRDFYGGDLRGIARKLDYLEDLGVTAIYLNPIFMAPSNHLYDTTDYYHIDPYFGTYRDYLHLVRKAERKGIHIILDGVFNHTSSDSLYFDRYSRYRTTGAYESQDSLFYDWYTFNTWPDDYNAWWGFDSLPVLTEIDEVRQFIYGHPFSVARWWPMLGSSGWRLDVAPDKSHEWWQAFRPRVKSVDPDAVILGEVWDDASPWILGNEFDSTMNYRFRRALVGFVNGDTNDANQGFIPDLPPDAFDRTLQSIQEDYPPPAFETAMNLVGTHDTARILWVLTPGDRNREDKEFNAANLAEGKAKLELLAILQMTMPGAPTIYYGDEVGLTGDTDPDDRRPFPWNDQDTALRDHYATLAGLRHRHTFLRTGSFDRLYTHNDDGTYAYGRKDASGAAVVAVNRDTVAHDLTLDLRGYVPEDTVLTDELNGITHTLTDGQITLTVDGRWGAILITPPGTDLTPPEPPAALSAAASDGSVTLTWDGVPGVAGYTVYRSPVTGGGYTRLNATPLTGTTYTDDAVVNGRQVYYAITAVDGAGNESARSNEAQALPHLEIGWANVQWPPGITHTISALNPTETIYGQVWIDGYTDQSGPTESLVAQVGYGPDGSLPEGDPTWVWVNAEFNVDAGNNDEFRGQLLPEAVEVYDYAYRYTTTGGLTWVYADLDGTGNGYDPAQAGNLTVIPSSDTVPPATPANLHVVEASPSFINLAWDGVPDADLYRYEVYRGDASSGPYIKVANVPAPATAYTDWSVTSGSTTYYVVLAVDTAFNQSGYSNEVEATAQARPVQVTFSVTLPNTTPDGDDIYIGGDLNGWDPSGTLMTRSSPTDLLATATLTLDEGTQIQYKYTRGSWTYVEKGAACEEVDNRTALVVYGTDGTLVLDDVVANWRNTGPCGD